MKSKLKGYGVIERPGKPGLTRFYPVAVVEETTGFFKKVTTEIKHPFHSGIPAFYWSYEIPGSPEVFDTKQEAEQFIKNYLNPVNIPTTVFHPYSSCDVYAPGEGPCNKQ